MSKSLLEDPRTTDYPAFQAFLRHTKGKPHDHEHWEMFRAGWEALEAKLNAEATEWWCNAW